MDSSPIPPSGSRYNQSDKLAIALAFTSVVVSIMLYLAEKSPLVVGLLLLLMIGFAVYPVVHFIRKTILRVAALVAVVMIGLTFGLQALKHNSGTEQRQIMAQAPVPGNVPRTKRKPSLASNIGQRNVTEFHLHEDGPPTMQPGGFWEQDFRIYPRKIVIRATGALSCSSQLDNVNMGIAGWGLLQGAEVISRDNVRFSTFQSWGPQDPLYFKLYSKQYGLSCRLVEIDAR